jgi:hypothetical protein
MLFTYFIKQTTFILMSPTKGTVAVALLHTVIICYMFRLFLGQYHWDNRYKRWVNHLCVSSLDKAARAYKNYIQYFRINLRDTANVLHSSFFIPLVWMQSLWVCSLRQQMFECKYYIYIYILQFYMQILSTFVYFNSPTFL